MALSTALKNQMLMVRPLSYRLKVEIQDEEATWVDFSDRDPQVRQVRMATESSMAKIVSSVSSVSFLNEDYYFDYMDDPDNATTVSLFGDLALHFAKGFRGKKVRISLIFLLEDQTYETAYLGQFKIQEKTSWADDRAEFSLAQDVDFLKKVGLQSMSDGFKQYNNRPISFLAREILRRIYPSALTDADFYLPGRISVPTADGEPAFSFYGKPPELDDTGRWRNDVTKNPCAMIWDEDAELFFFGIEGEIWSWDPTTEIWSFIHDMGTDSGGIALWIRGFFKWSSTKILVMAVAERQFSRSINEEHGYIDTSGASPAYTSSSGANFYSIWDGSFVIRDVNTEFVGNEMSVGRVGNHTGGDPDYSFGLNLAVPFPQRVRSGINNAYNKSLGWTTAGIRGVSPSSQVTVFGSGAYAETDILQPCWVNYHNVGISSSDTCLMAWWGHGPNIAFASSLYGWTGPYLFMVRWATHDLLGVRNSGAVKISAINTYTGAWIDVGPTTGWTGANSPIYGLKYFKAGASGKDYLYWIAVDWVEDYATANNPVDAIWKIKYASLVDSGGNPSFTGTGTALWSAGDNFFDADDAGWAPIEVVPFEVDSRPSGWLIAMMDMEDMGGECFHLVVVDATGSGTGFDTKTEIASSTAGWGAFTIDNANHRIYFVDRETGRICYVTTSSIPTAFDVLDDGNEPVPQSPFELVQPGGLVIRTESSKTTIYGVAYPALPGICFENEGWPQGKYYLWKHHQELTDRVELFEEGKLTAWDAIGSLAEVVNYQVGMDPEGVGFFKPLPTSSDPEEFTIDVDSEIGRYFSLRKLDGLKDIINRSQWIPFEVVIGEPEATLDLKGYTEASEQKYYNGETAIRSETTLEKNVSLLCIKEGNPGTAAFKYMIHDIQVEARLREDTNYVSFPTRIRLDNNADVQVGMLVQIGDVDESGGTPYHVDTIEDDGDVILNQSLTKNFEKGVAVIFKSAEDGVWSTEYAVPLTLVSTAGTYVQIATTGIFLKFTAASAPQRFVIGDRIHVYNPGQKLQRSRTKKFTIENSASIERWGLAEDNLENQFMSFTIGKERTKKLVSDEKDPHHRYEATCPLFLQAKPLMVVKVKGVNLLPTATDNEEKTYIVSVTHTLDRAETKLELRGISSY